MELNKVYNENALFTLNRMPDNFIDLTVTSPPYDKLRDYKGYKFPFRHIARKLYDKTAGGGVVVWIVGDQTVNGSETGTSLRQALFFLECGFRLHDTMIYEKAGCGMPSGNRYLQTFEYMFVFSKGKPKTANLILDRKNRFRERWGKGRSVREKNGELSYRGNYQTREFGQRFNIWRYATGYGYGSKDKLAFQHPATFPEKLAADHIYTWSNPGDIVYDPFGGSGTTAKEAHKQGRQWILSEISKDYAELSEMRIEPFINQQTLNL